MVQSIHVNVLLSKRMGRSHGTRTTLLTMIAPKRSEKDSVSGRATNSTCCVRIRWLPVLLVGVLLSACARCANAPTRPNTRQAGCWRSDDVSPFIVFESRETAVESQRYVQTQLELLRNRVVLEPILSRSEIAQLPELAGCGRPGSILARPYRDREINDFCA